MYSTALADQQELLNEMKTLKQKIGELDEQLNLSKGNLDTYVSPRAEVDNIKVIPPNIAGNAVSNNLDGFEYDAEREELGVAEANDGNGSVETEVQSEVKSYQKLKKWYLMPPCLALSIIRWGSRVRCSNPGNGVAPSPTPRCISYWKGSLQVTLD